MCVFCECKLFLTCSGGGAMTGWNGSNFLFLVGGRRTCGQAQNVAKGPASWAQRSRAVERESCLTIVRQSSPSHTWYTFTSPIHSRMN